MRRPASSITALILPVRLRRVASGLMIENVRSIAISLSRFADFMRFLRAYSDAGRRQQAPGGPLSCTSHAKVEVYRIIARLTGAITYEQCGPAASAWSRGQAATPAC